MMMSPFKSFWILMTRLSTKTLTMNTLTRNTLPMITLLMKTLSRFEVVQHHLQPNTMMLTAACISFLGYDITRLPWPLTLWLADVERTTDNQSDTSDAVLPVSP